MCINLQKNLSKYATKSKYLNFFMDKWKKIYL